METKENLELIKKAKLGEQEAIEELIQQSMKLIHSINANFGRTEDGVQEGILGVYRAIASFDESYKVKFSTHAYNHIYKHIKNYYDKEKYKASLHHTRLIKAGKTEYSGQVELLEAIEAETVKLDIDTKIFIETLIEKTCNEKEKEFIHKLYYEGKREVDIARELNITRQAVNNYKNHILQKLRRGLDVGNKYRKK